MERSLLQLEAAVLVSGLVLAAMVLNGITRSPDSDRLLRSVISGAYSLSYGMVAYAVGLVQERSFFHSDTFSLWVTALLLLQASAYAAPSRDMDQLRMRLLHHVLQTGLVLWLVVNSLGHNTSYRAAIWAFWSLNVLKTAARIVEVFKARPLRPSVKVVSEYMDVEPLLATDQLPADPTTMKGYKYLFHGEEAIQGQLSHQPRSSQDEILMTTTTTSSVLRRTTSSILTATMSFASAKEVVTIDQVYRWIDEQGYSDVEKDMAKDMCLAFSLFKLLKRRFYGYIPAETGSLKSLDLVLTGLIHHAVTGPDTAFRVVEAELAFLYDFFYTRNIVLTGARTHMFTAVLVLGLSMWATFFGTLGHGYSRMVIGVRNLDRAVTVVIVVIIAALELCQAVTRLYDNWKYIEAVYRCVRDNRPWSKRPRRQLWWKESIAPPEIMYWDREQMAGQYVLLQCIVEEAARLGGQIGVSVPDEGRRWKVLAEFWAEFILFLGPSDNVDIHAEMLGAGGEFMTQLWALLSHAGILERPAAATPSAPRA
ncbi:hypothetical protein TRIUR3_33020 [Triticum urartu]|uniref:Uncharacterized protein n=1 Tax=Triticum urartu TaxID=4572 RepID=M7ZB08_TRIUA|nr:hypothetical protein TRIUR3_33020 [Triticum urartu]